VPSTGAHSAILNLHDPSTDAIVFRTSATIVAPERFNRTDGTLRLTGRVPLLQSRAHYLAVPADIASMNVELKVIRGAVRVTVLQSNGLLPNYYYQVFPQPGRTFTPGSYDVMLPDPVSGTWALMVDNTSAWREANQALVSTEDAEYTLTVRLRDASVRPRVSRAGVLQVGLENHGASLGEPTLQASIGALRLHRGRTLATALPNLFDITVPPGAATLALQLRSVGPSTQTFELYLYDCTTGECFSYNFTLPAGPRQRLVVRQPAAGRWVAAINAAPTPQAALPFELEEVVAIAPLQTIASHAQLPAAKWSDTLQLPLRGTAQPGTTQVLLLELVDRAMEQSEADHPWETRSVLPRLRDRPVAVGVSIYPLP